MDQQFGGPWTELKLDVLQQYLAAYAKVMKNQHHLRTHYIDAFAGTGYVELRGTASGDPTLLSELDQAERESHNLLQGSAEIALEIEPQFDEFTFIEQNRERASELAKLQARHLDRGIRIIPGDANEHLREICSRWDRAQDRAVVFLDPFAMSVDWDTLRCLAQTESMDVWYLFPLMAVNRMLPRERDPLPEWESKLNRFFGTENWRATFYRRRPMRTLFNEVDDSGPQQEQVLRVNDWNGMRDFFLSRLRTLFCGVAENPLFLRNSAGTPLFMLCFAMNNPRGTAKDIALRIAEHILGHQP